MRLNPLMLAPAGVVLALAACAAVPADQAEVTGTAAYRERILLPPGHVLTSASRTLRTWPGGIRMRSRYAAVPVTAA